MENPDEMEGESFQTKVRQMYAAIVKESPEVIERINELPSRVKVAKGFKDDNLVVYIKKGIGLFARGFVNGSDKPEDLVFEDTLSLIECGKEEKALPLSDSFWENYMSVKAYKDAPTMPLGPASIEMKALNSVNALLDGKIPEIEKYLPFLRDIREDMLEYKTLSEYTLRRIANLCGSNKVDNKLKGIKEELDKLKKELGENYLDKVKARVGSLETEVIIAIENIKE